VERQVANGPTLRSREPPEPAQHQRALSLLQAIVERRNARVGVPRAVAAANDLISPLKIRCHEELVVFANDRGEDLFVIDAGINMRPEKTSADLVLAGEIVGLCRTPSVTPSLKGGARCSQKDDKPD
jgi:hypothetical protein